MDVVNLSQGESKNFRMTFRDRDGELCILTDYEVEAYAKRDPNDTFSEALFVKNDVDFDKTSAAVGVIVVNLTADDLDFSGYAYVYIRFTKAVDSVQTNIEKAMFLLSMAADS